MSNYLKRNIALICLLPPFILVAILSGKGNNITLFVSHLVCLLALLVASFFNGKIIKNKSVTETNSKWMDFFK